MSANQDRQAAMRAAEDLARRPPSTARRRQVDRAAGAAEILARQLQQRAISRSGRRGR